MEDALTLLKYLFLGLLQGFTEPIPISSSGHLVIAQQLLGMEIEGLSFEVFVNFASLLAVLLIYRRELFRMIGNAWRYVTKTDSNGRSDFMFVVFLAVGTVPAALAGFLFEDAISEALKGTRTIGVTLLLTGVALWLIRNLRGRKQDQDLTLKDAVVVGLAQAVALIPGISRSGATIVAAMSLGMKQDTALKFSFFLYIPISIGGMVLVGADIADDPAFSTLLLPYLAAFAAALVASYFALRWFMGIMARGNLKWFSLYCFIAGTAVLLWL